MNYTAWVVKAAKQPMLLETIDLEPLGVEDVAVGVENCGLCHSDLSVWNNDWAPLDWDAMIGTLAPNGRLHVVGAVLEPVPVAAFSLILQQRSVSGSPSGSPMAIETMLDFASRHNIAPQTERFPMSKINEAFARLESGKARYRIVLDADF